MLAGQNVILRTGNQNARYSKGNIVFVGIFLIISIPISSKSELNWLNAVHFTFYLFWWFTDCQLPTANCCSPSLSLASIATVALFIAVHSAFPLFPTQLQKKRILGICERVCFWWYAKNQPTISPTAYCQSPIHFPVVCFSLAPRLQPHQYHCFDSESKQYNLSVWVYSVFWQIIP